MVKNQTASLFADNIQGRVDITNDFDGKELNTEYIYGLFTSIANNNTFSLLPIPIAYEERVFISNGNIASTSTLVTSQHVATGVKLPIIVDILISINEDGLIDQYDAIFKRHDWFLERMNSLTLPFIAQSINAPASSLTPLVLQNIYRQLIAKSVCGVAQTYCTGANQQFDSLNDCMAFFQNLTFGTSYQFGQNTAVCRMLHQEMIPYRPDVHCMHIGPSGGDMCIDRNYSQVAEDVFFRHEFIEKI